LEAAVVMYREISVDQALAIRAVLVEECGYRVHDRYDQFVDSIRTDAGKKHVCHEYRFMGALGFGGKFRNNGNQNNTPHVDCYREDETPDRLAMIERANARIARLFA
jgi:hypothetical protein